MTLFHGSAFRKVRNRRYTKQLDILDVLMKQANDNSMKE